MIGGGEPIAGRVDALRILDGIVDMLEPRAVAGVIRRYDDRQAAAHPRDDSPESTKP